MSKIKLKPLVSAIVLALAGADVVAQGFELEEIIVTATKRSASLQDVPVAVNAFSAETIQNAGINDAHDLANMTPSLSLTTSRDPFTSRMSIRGIGTSQNDPALEPSVGMFVDGVFFGRTGLGMSDLTDIERIEVLQGPQGTLYGKNTNAGAISIITKRPNLEEFEGSAAVAAGNYGMQKVTLSATGPLNDSVAYRVSGSTHQRDGFYNNAGTADPSNADDWNLQGKLSWEVSDQLSVLLSATHVDRDTTGGGTDVLLGDSVQAELANQGLSPLKSDAYDYEMGIDTESKFEMEADTVSVHVTYDMDWGELTSITGWNEYDYFSRADSDGSELDIIRNLGEPYSGDSLSQEFRLDSTLGESIDYQVGLFYYDSTTRRGDGSASTVLGDDFLTIATQELSPLLGLISQPGDSISGSGVWNSETLAVFSQMTWHATDELHITGGLRWTDEEKQADLYTQTFTTATPPGALSAFVDILATNIDDTFERRSINTDWLFKVAQDVGEESMVYVSASTGTKSGNFNGVNGTADQREFQDEDTMSFELGFKSNLLDSRLRLNAAAFFTEIKDWQFQYSLPEGGTVVSNEGAVEVSGVDVSIQALPFENLTLEAGLLYMDKYEVTEGPNAGKQLAYTADLSGNLAATVLFPFAEGTIYLRGDYVFMGDHWTTNANSRDKALDWNDRNVLNAKLGWRNEQWNLSVWGKNLTADDYASLTNPYQSFSGNKAYVLAAPRTFGVDARYNF